jgi:hypothetical protein
MSLLKQPTRKVAAERKKAEKDVPRIGWQVSDPLLLSIPSCWWLPTDAKNEEDVYTD